MHVVDNGIMKKYLIIGGTGSLGHKLIERLLVDAQVAVYSRDEAKHWTIRNELSSMDNVLQSYINNLSFFVGDIRDASRIKDVIRQYKPTTIIIAAALKQVDTCELSPSEAIATNLTGTQNVIDAVNELNPELLTAVLFVSTDKACSPVNVYGMCKAISERIVTSQAMSGNSRIKYLVVRYGNVLESRGSIIPLLKYQAENGSFLTITDPNMTRYVMTLDESVNLINYALEYGESGTTWVPKLPSMKIGDLAEIFSKAYKKPIKIIGCRPGEKAHEDLINQSESVRTLERGMYYAIDAAFKSGKEKSFTYTSADTVMTQEQLEKHLENLGILNMKLEQFKGLTIEEIATNRKE